MPDPSRFRDSTQIVLPWAAFESVRGEVESRFTVSVVETDRCGHPSGCARIIGSPVEIKQVSAFLTRHGVSLP
ncbi:VNG_1110C family protein [Halorarius litoreus]|uniref:VNG_1110C family protein n=1 Tax=Halorarius litoreus TaxID=2962676 RepID=UPI0020CE0A3C|nr:hypothetical protein [Halorarius litoreus]